MIFDCFGWLRLSEWTNMGGPRDMTSFLKDVAYDHTGGSPARSGRYPDTLSRLSLWQREIKRDFPPPDPGSGPGWREGKQPPGFSLFHCLHKATARLSALPRNKENGNGKIMQSCRFK
jgi:hypothetical protein